MVPASDEAFVLDPQFLGVLLLEHVERDVLENREILRRVPGANPRMVLMHRDIEHPAETVLDGPVAAHDASEAGRIGRQAGDEEAGVVPGVVADGPVAIQPEDAPQPLPAPTARQPGEIVGGAGTADFDAPVVPIDGFGGRVGQVAEDASFRMANNVRMSSCKRAWLPLRLST